MKSLLVDIERNKTSIWKVNIIDRDLFILSFFSYNKNKHDKYPL
jgi:hypothetical protein